MRNEEVKRPLQSDIHIVLTGTIVPNALSSGVNDPSKRRQEYLNSIAFYSQFAPVHFLENSVHDCAGDAAFQPSDRLKVHEFPVSTFAERGKGFQEFEMLDSWVASKRGIPDRWLKITGRYLIKNVSDVLKDCDNVGEKFVIDLCKRPRIARTHLFFVTTDFYLQHLLGCYRRCNDDSGDWIERVLYQQIASSGAGQSRTFSVNPDLTAVSGSTGKRMNSSTIEGRLKAVLRRCNRVFDKQYLWYAQ